MISLPQRQQIMHWVEEANTAGARSHKACELLGIAPRTLQRWRQNDELLGDARRTRSYVPANKLSDQEREQIIAVANSDEFVQVLRMQIEGPPDAAAAAPATAAKFHLGGRRKMIAAAVAAAIALLLIYFLSR